MIKTHILIIGGGISGLAIAYNLVERGVKDLVVIEKSYIGSGSTGRCATGIRASFTSEEHVVLMKHSIELWKEYVNGELGKNGLYYDQSGYVWIASREETVETFKKLVKLHNSLGVPTKMIDLDELKEKVPPINTNGILAAMYDPTAGKSYPFDTLFAFYKSLKSRGVRIETHTMAKKLLVSNSKVLGAETNKGIIESDIVVIAAGSMSRDLLKPLGINMPIENIPRHVMITEAYKPAFGPLVVDWDTPGAPYIIQTKEGNFYIGRDIEEEPELSLYSQRIDFMPLALKPLIRFFPWLENTRVLRYWIGYYVTTPDHHPIYGPIEEYDNLYVATGYSGHGYMMGPITGKVITEWILDGKPSIPQAERLTLERFKKGKLIKELAVIG